jgi:hypothetical protein
MASSRSTDEKRCGYGLLAANKPLLFTRTVPVTDPRELPARAVMAPGVLIK